MNKLARLFACAALCAGTVGIAAPAGAVVIVDRGLPTTNLNNAAGGDRSNVAWDFGGDYFAIDTFVLPALPAGMAKWEITEITTWFYIAGSADNDADTDDDAGVPGDRYSSVELYVGRGSDVGDPLSLTASANIAGDTTDNADVTLSRVQYASAEPELDYQGSSGSYLQTYEITFSGLSILGDAGEVFSFGVEGEGATDPFWFTHASNAALGGAAAESADDLFGWAADTGGDTTVGGFLTSDQPGVWDKPSDLNIIVGGTGVPIVPEPGAIALLMAGLAGLGVVRRKRR